MAAASAANARTAATPASHTPRKALATATSRASGAGRPAPRSSRSNTDGRGTSTASRVRSHTAARSITLRPVTLAAAVTRARRRPGGPGHRGDAAAGPQPAHQPADRDPPQPRRDVAVAAEAPRLLPDRDKGVLDCVRHQVAVVAPPGEPDREPPGVALIQHAERAHVTFGDSQKQRLIARAAVHDLTVASPARKRFTPGRKFPGPSTAT